ncbi:unnamed protein product [Mytilus edulis]|uniref:F-box domain-containing protein n=1 Tax=Mytilus edulis TaxID=6550 RepID=A0A8S3Q6F3_MYTED|nr:unnamed protein product [Mytilus edulis]
MRGTDTTLRGLAKSQQYSRIRVLSPTIIETSNKVYREKSYSSVHSDMSKSLEHFSSRNTSQVRQHLFGSNFASTPDFFTVDTENVHKLGPMQRQIRFGTVRKPKGVDDLPVTLQKSYKNVKWWTGAPKKGKIFLKAQKVDLMSNFKDQLKQIWTWQGQWEGYEKINLLKEVLKLCGDEVLSQLTTHIQQRIRDTRDVNRLSDKLLLYIFSFLTPHEIFKASQVCRRWRFLCDTDDLWMIKCHELELYFSKESYIPIPWQQFLPVLVTIPSTAKGAELRAAEEVERLRKQKEEEELLRKLALLRKTSMASVSGVGLEQDSEPVPVRTLPFTPGASQLRLSRPSRVSHTVTRPAEIPTSPVACTTSRQETLPAGIRSDPFSRTRWPMNFAYPPMPMGMPNLPPYPQPFDPYSAQSVWSGQGFGGRSSSESSSFKDEMRSLTTSIHKIQATVNAKFLEFGNRLDLMESRGLSQDPAQDPPRPPRQLLEDDSVSLAPRSQEGNFLEDQDGISDVDSVVSTEGDAFAPKDPASGNPECLRSLVYSIRRNMSDMPMSSPPRVSSTPSDFMACSGIVKPESKGYYSFPESGHFTTALSFVNSSLAENLANTSKTGGSKFSGFGPASYPGRCRSKDFEIHGSSLGMSAPACDRAFSSLLGSKPLDGLRLSQASYVKSENNLRCLTFVLETAEHFLSAAGSLLKDKGEEFSDLRSMLLQVDKSLGMSQFLLLGTVANFTLAKRQEILEKSTVSEALQQRLVSSPLSKDKLFSVSLEQLQEEVNKAPPVVKVDVKVTDGKRFVKTTQMNNPSSSSSSHQPKASTSSSSSQSTKRPAFSRPNYSSGKKAKVVKGKKQVGGQAVPLSRSMGSDNFRQVGTFDFTEGIGTSVSGTASSFSCSNQSVSDKGFSKESVVTKRSEHSDSEGCIGGDGGVVSSYSGSSHSFLPRRFSHQESLPFSFGGTHQFVYPFTPETGFFDFMGKIRDNSQSEFQFPGRTFSDRFGSSASSRREGSQGMSVSQCSDSVFICPSSSIASAGGFLDFDHGRHSTRTSTHSSNPVVSDGVLASNFSVVGGTCSHPSSVVTSSSMVASGKTSSEGSFVGSSRPQPNFVHRCESDGLGSLSGGQDSIRPLVRCSVGGTHQSSRDESCVSFSPSVSGCDSGSVTTGCHGQLHSSGLSSESRRDPFLFSVSSEQGNSSSVSQSQYFSVSETCSRQSKSSGGCSLPFPCSSEHRMGNSSISVSGDHSSLGSSSYRSFCHQSESQIGDLRFSHSRRESLGSRCYDPILEGNVQLHVPSFSSSSKDLAQDSEGSLQDHSYCSGLVKTVLVPRTTTSVLCEAPLFASKRGSTVSIQRKKTASRSGESPSARLVVVRDSLRKGGFSEGATKRISGSVRQSTGAVYDSKWSIFCTWCLSKQINPLSVTVQQLADFFLYLFEEKGYSPSTIKGYRSAIARTISLSGGSDFGDNEFLSLLIKNFCLNRPRQRRLVPSWDLGLVLKVLQFSPFEPLHSASFKFLSYKCCFLIALATGRRRSEIHALSISESCLRFASDKSSVTLLTDPSFLAKNQLPDKGSGIITIPALPPTSDNQVLCPVRALLVYLASSAKLRSAGSSRLFIPIKKGISDISAKTISTWICNTVILAYKSASSEVLVKHQVKAHEVRALASSWNIFNSSSMSEIMSAGLSTSVLDFQDLLEKYCKLFHLSPYAELEVKRGTLSRLQKHEEKRQQREITAATEFKKSRSSSYWKKLRPLINQARLQDIERTQQQVKARKALKERGKKEKLEQESKKNRKATENTFVPDQMRNVDTEKKTDETAFDIRTDLIQARDILGKSMPSMKLEWRQMEDTDDKTPRPFEMPRYMGIVKSVKRVRRLQGHLNSILCVHFDKKRLISAGLDRTIRLWDIRSGKSIHKFYGHKGGIRCLQFEGNTLLTGSWDTTIIVWDLRTFEKRTVLAKHTDCVSCLYIGPEYIISGSYDKTVRVWFRQTLIQWKVIRGHTAAVNSVSCDGDCFVSGSSDMTLRLVNIQTSECLRIFSGCQDQILSVVMQGDLIISGDSGGHVYFWNKETGETEAAVQAHDGQIHKVCFHKGRFFTASSDSTVREWDLMSMTSVRVLQGHKGPVRDIKLDARILQSSSGLKLKSFNQKIYDDFMQHACIKLVTSIVQECS